MTRGGRAARDAGAGTAIEFVAPRAGLFGGGIEPGADVDLVAAPEFGDDPPPRRWGTAAAVLTVVALIAVGVAAAAPWGDEAAPATTLPAATTMPDTSPATVPDATADDASAFPGDLVPGEAGYLLDPDAVPAGYEVQWADRPHVALTPAQTGSYQVWATPNSTRTQGSWFGLEVIPASNDSWRTLPVSTAARIAVGDGVGTQVIDDDGVVSLQWPIDARHDGRFTAFGWAPEALVRLATGITLDAGDAPQFADPSFQLDHRLVTSGLGMGWGLSLELLIRARSTITWLGPEGEALTVTTLPAYAALDKTLYDFLLAPVPDEEFTGPRTFWAEGDLTLTVGRLADLSGTTVKWTVGDSTVLLTGDLPVVDLIALVHHVRVGSSDEWRDAYRAGVEQETTASPSGEMGPDVASGVTSSGRAWAAGLTRDGTSAWIRVDDMPAGHPSGALTTFFPLDDPLHVMTTADSSLVLALLPATSGATEVRIVGPWGERIEELVASETSGVGDGSSSPGAADVALVVAVVDVTELGGFTVTVVDAGGTPLAGATVGRTAG